MKKLRFSKTFVVNMLIVAAAVLAGVMGTDVIAANPEYAVYFTAATGVVNILLRILTNKAIKGI